MTPRLHVADSTDPASDKRAQIQCPYCQSCWESKVVESRGARFIKEVDGVRTLGVWRRRQCLNMECRRRFSTHEVVSA